VDAIAAVLGEADPENAQMYSANAAAYDEKLLALDDRFRAAVEDGTLDTVLFGDRFPFRYLMDDYGISYYAAFAGCSAETEASFDTIIFLAGKVNELGLHTILAIEGDSLSMAQTIMDTAGKGELSIGVMDSMQAVTAEKIEEGTTYLAVMEKNLEVLSAALA
jgi:zinc transport system substrate-binding protein